MNGAMNYLNYRFLDNWTSDFGSSNLEFLNLSIPNWNSNLKSVPDS